MKLKIADANAIQLCGTIASAEGKDYKGRLRRFYGEPRMLAEVQTAIAETWKPVTVWVESWQIMG
jgi:hypothetical protein